MLFSEPFFLFLFLPLVLAGYYAARPGARNAVLAAASLLFYSFGESRFLGWLVASVALNYWVGRAIEKTRGTRTARRWLAFGVVSDLALLVVFKYAGFLVANLDALLGAVGLPVLRAPDLLLPLGISFFTFHKISYKVDVFRGDAEAKKSPLDLALYILLFPQLIAGPIVRFNEIAGELAARVSTLRLFAVGVRRFVVGLGKKMIVANTAAYCADRVFKIPGGELTASVAWLGIVCYAVQIYFDFSGYSDMAIGLAAMFGFHFPENFDHPYASSSITEFWRRWHMSLSRWFRDYVYIPLGGNRVSPARTYLNLVTVFFLCGLWHGASWNFVVWGAFHGVLLVIERLCGGASFDALPRPLRHAATLALVLVGWVFFRTDSLPQAAVHLTAMAGLAPAASGAYFPGMYLDRELILVLVVGAVASAPVRGAVAAAARRAGARWTFAAGDVALAGVFAYSLTLMAAGTYNPFIYFRF